MNKGKKAAPADTFDLMRLSTTFTLACYTSRDIQYPLPLHERDRSKAFWKHTSDKARVYEYLKEHCATATMTALVCGVSRPSMCRIKRDLEKRGRLYPMRQGICQLTGYRAWYLTTDLAKISNSIQLELFPTGKQKP